MVDRYPDKIKLHLSDFGFAITFKELENTCKFDSVGTPTYLPYEMLTAHIVNGKWAVKYDQRVDIWCLGVLLYEVLYGSTPFMTDPFDKEKTKGLIRALKFSFPKPDKYPLAEDLISRILVKPRDRLSLD